MHTGRTHRGGGPTRSVSTMKLEETLARIGEEVRERFDAQRRVLDFTTYLGMVQQSPSLYLRDATAYLRGALDHFGTEEVTRPWGSPRTPF